MLSNLLTPTVLALALIHGCITAPQVRIESPSIESAFKGSFKLDNGIFVPPCSNRKAWVAVRHKIEKSALKSANWSLINPQPAWNDEAYLVFLRNGSRIEGQNMLRDRTDRLMHLLQAECYYGQGTYIQTINTHLMGIATQKSWALPAHDKKLKFFNGQEYFVDLYSGYVSSVLAFGLHLMNGTLPASTVTGVTSQLRTRTVQPILKSLQLEQLGSNWWMNASSNWNTVCWSNVMMALHTYPAIATPDERVILTDAAWNMSARFFDVFTQDNYDAEGVGYFNYAFLDYITLRETLLEATKGVHDIFSSTPDIAKNALYGLEFGMTDKSYASFGDCPQKIVMSSSISSYLTAAFDLGKNNFTVGSSLLTAKLLGYFPRNIQKVAGVKTDGMNAFRKFYNISGVLVARPTNNSSNIPKGFISGTFKHGGNFGGHSHNDIGSYVLSVDSVKLTGDLGGPETYEARSFDKRRYHSPIMNSYGHPVPVVNGQLQTIAEKLVESTAWKAKTWFNSSFNDDEDTLVYDMTPAYNVTELKSLYRTIVYDRYVGGAVEITDSVEYKAGNGTFETALIAIQNYTLTSPTTGFFWGEKATPIQFKVEADDEFVLEPKDLADYGIKFTRIAARFVKPVSKGSITVTFYTDSMDLNVPCDSITS